MDPYLTTLSDKATFLMDDLAGFVWLIVGFWIFKGLVMRLRIWLDERFPWRKKWGKRLLVCLGILVKYTVLTTGTILFIAWVGIYIGGPPDYWYRQIEIREKTYQELGVSYEVQEDWTDVPHHERRPILRPKKGAAPLPPPPPNPNSFSVFAYTRAISFGIFLMFLSMFILEEYATYTDREHEREVERIRLEKEHERSRFLTLKKQLNPHFMFNSLNVLAELIHEDIGAADRFIHELSKNYRYVLEQGEELLVSLGEELTFIQSYAYLLKMRFEDKLSMEVHVPESARMSFLPPMTLEILVENAVKHNELRNKHPLKIDIYCRGDRLIVQNSYQPRKHVEHSLGIGLRNLKERLRIIGLEEPKFGVVDNHYVAEIPLYMGDKGDLV